MNLAIAIDRSSVTLEELSTSDVDDILSWVNDASVVGDENGSARSDEKRRS